MKAFPGSVPEEEFLKAFAKELAKATKQKKLSQKTVLDETGIHIGRLEAKGRSPKLFCYYCLCVYLGVPFERILNNVKKSLTDTR